MLTAAFSTISTATATVQLHLRHKNSGLWTSKIAGLNNDCMLKITVWERFNLFLNMPLWSLLYCYGYASTNDSNATLWRKSPTFLLQMHITAKVVAIGEILAEIANQTNYAEAFWRQAAMQRFRSEMIKVLRILWKSGGFLKTTVAQYVE